MDGIFSGLTSIVPIMPEQTTISDRSGIKGPPVEIMPLPSNSFMSDDATTEMLNNPFTLSLDIRGHNDGRANVPKTASKTAYSEDVFTGATLAEAYTLSLSNEENAPVAAEIAREMSRMKNYEMLGKSTMRQIYRLNPKTGAAENIKVPNQSGGDIDLISEKVRNFLSQSTAQQNGDINILPKGVTLTTPELITEEAVNQLQASQPKEATSASVRQDMSLLSSLATGQLSASDIEAILTLEPELQEALLNMLSNDETSPSQQNTVKANPLGNGSGDEPVSTYAQSGQGAPLENNTASIDKTLLVNSQQGIIQQTLINMTKPLNSQDIKRMTDVPVTAQDVIFTEDELARLTADALAGGKVMSGRTANTLFGSMQNLRKVTELPYSLYIFGNIVPAGKGKIDEEGKVAISEESEAQKKNPAELLRISEAIKMASVLHNIYYGGSGRFPQVTPWYEPYIRYAIKNGIIKNNDFGDYSELATRAEMAYIFSGSVPRAEFQIINFVSDIPDVIETIGYGDRIYLLFRAGVLMKTDKNGSFHPESVITKTEASSIIGRIATPDDRKRII